MSTAENRIHDSHTLPQPLQTEQGIASTWLNARTAPDGNPMVEMNVRFRTSLTEPAISPEAQVERVEAVFMKDTVGKVDHAYTIAMTMQDGTTVIIQSAQDGGRSQSLEYINMTGVSETCVAIMRSGVIDVKGFTGRWALLTDGKDGATKLIARKEEIAAVMFARYTQAKEQAGRWLGEYESQATGATKECCQRAREAIVGL